MSDFLADGATLQLGNYLESPSGKYFFGIFPTSDLSSPGGGLRGELGIFSGTPQTPGGISLSCSTNVSSIEMKCWYLAAFAPGPSTSVWVWPGSAPPPVVNAYFCRLRDDATLCIYEGNDPSDQGLLVAQLAGKTSGFDPMPLCNGTAEVLGSTRIVGDVSVEWANGTSPSQIIGGADIGVVYESIPIGTPCWMTFTSTNFSTKSAHFMAGVATGNGKAVAFELIPSTAPRLSDPMECRWKRDN